MSEMEEVEFGSTRIEINTEVYHVILDCKNVILKHSIKTISHLCTTASASECVLFLISFLLLRRRE